MKKFLLSFLGSALIVSSGFVNAKLNLENLAEINLNNLVEIELALVAKGVKTPGEVSEMNFEQKRQLVQGLIIEQQEGQSKLIAKASSVLQRDVMQTPSVSPAPVEPVAFQEAVSTTPTTIFGFKTKLTIGTAVVALVAAYSINGLTPEGRELVQNIKTAFSGIGSGLYGWASNLRK